ncbi:MAG: ABC transporter ATP-binding protein, partial [Firmicutes bacterium]|nr:ABC transporter ATP-binding protein [Bacillota bacterium]
THDIDEAILLSDRVYVLAGRPGKITGEITIDRARPRDREFSLSPEFLHYKREILSAMGME